MKCSICEQEKPDCFRVPFQKIFCKECFEKDPPHNPYYSTGLICIKDPDKFLDELQGWDDKVYTINYISHLLSMPRSYCVRYLNMVKIKHKHGLTKGDMIAFVKFLGNRKRVPYETAKVHAARDQEVLECDLCHQIDARINLIENSELKGLFAHPKCIGKVRRQRLREILR